MRSAGARSDETEYHCPERGIYRFAVYCVEDIHAAGDGAGQ